MSAAVLLNPTARRDRAVVLSALVVLSLFAWLFLIYQAWGMSHCDQVLMLMPDTRLWRPFDFFLLFVMWAVMMVAMMVPSAAPMVLVFASLNRQRRQNESPFVPTWIFLCGYLFAWAVFSVLATVGQWALHVMALLSPMMVSTNYLFGGLVLITAGIFQFAPVKNACLRHCQSPFDFIMTRWQEGRWGAFLMGLRHGAFCTGCCWTLMALLFVGGVMNLSWVALISIFVLIEKVAFKGLWFSRLSGGLLVIGGILMAVKNYY
jgi:predicted metal-binding membrane protein